jgi:hypothetical protein
LISYAPDFLDEHRRAAIRHVEAERLARAEEVIE